MNYNVLRYFSVLAQVEHYTLAAARLGISQPTLSGAIHNLENDLGGVKLFEKTGRNVRLTAEGRFYQEKVDAALQELHSASMVLRDRSLHFRKLNQQEFYVALPTGHPLADCHSVLPQDVIREPQIVFNYNVDKSFKQWATGAPTDESVLCTVNTAQSALDLVAAGVGIAFIPERCVQVRPDVRFVPMKNWHQALYMCILYDKWLEPPVWDFVELLVKSIRESVKGYPYEETEYCL